MFPASASSRVTSLVDPGPATSMLSGFVFWGFPSRGIVQHFVWFIVVSGANCVSKAASRRVLPVW